MTTPSATPTTKGQAAASEWTIPIAGRWLDAAEIGHRFEVTNPSTGDPIATLPDVGAHGVQHAVDAAVEAQPAWGRTSARIRSAILRRTYDLMLERSDDLAHTVTLEHGKPLPEAKAEVAYAASFASWFAGEAERSYGRTVPADEPGRKIVVIRSPVGVTGAITPWNFPIAMVVRKIAPALAAGCTVILKPSDLTPLSALNVARILEEAGLPPAVLSVVCSSDPRPVGVRLLADPRVRKITFTGSTRVGKELIRGSADTVTRLSLELGGNAPFIVFDDADLDAALDGLMIAKMRNAGQSCIAANRIYVHRSIEPEFTKALCQRMAMLKIGDGLTHGVTVGPLINQSAVDKVTRHISDAVAKGATLEAGGSALSGTFMEPTVLSGVTDDMLITVEETFGPVAAMIPFDDEAEVITRANAQAYGLAAYYYTRDLGRISRLADELEFGIHGVNEGFVSVAQAPFGGFKESGIGREGGAEGIEEFTETKYLSMRC